MVAVRIYVAGQVDRFRGTLQVKWCPEAQEWLALRHQGGTVLPTENVQGATCLRRRPWV